MVELKDVAVQANQKLSEAFVDNALQVSSHMSKEVMSGKVAEVFGPKYTAESLAGIADQMRNEILELTPGSGHMNEQRKVAIEEERSKQQFSLRYLEKMLPLLDLERSNRFMELRSEMMKEPELRPFDSFVKGAFYSYFVGNNPSFSLMYDTAKIDMEADKLVDIGEESFHWEMEAAELKKMFGGKVKARVSLSSKILPVTQEEYFHAAQELSLGNVEGVKYLDKRVGLASKHVTHGSIILDRILSSAAAEQGPEEFAYWSSKADEVTQEFKDQHLTNTKSKWDKTPLGKEVNKRFLYPLVDHRELGAMIFNYTKDVESFFFNPDGSPNEKNEAIFELLSLQFGQNHKDLSLALVDAVASSKAEVPDFEHLGKQLVEWGKRLLAYYKGRPEEYELVTHHTDMKGELNPSNLRFEVSKKLVESVNSEVGRDSGIPTTEITLQALAKEARDNAQVKLDTILRAIRVDQTANTVQLVNPTVLRELGLDPMIFSLIVKHAANNFQRHTRSYFASRGRSGRYYPKAEFARMELSEVSDHIKDLLKLIERPGNKKT